MYTRHQDCSVVDDRTWIDVWEVEGVAYRKVKRMDKREARGQYVCVCVLQGDLL